MAFPVSPQASCSSQVHYSQPIQQNEGTSIPSGSVKEYIKEYTLGSAKIHDKIGGDIVTIRHWTDKDGKECFQPFIDDATLREPFGPSVRALYGLQEEFYFEHSQDITFEMDGPDYIKVTEIDGDKTSICYVDLRDKKKLDGSEGYGYTAYSYKPIAITEHEVKLKIANTPDLSSSQSLIVLYNSHGIAVFDIGHVPLSIYCAAPGCTTLAKVDHVISPPDISLPSLYGILEWKAVWNDAPDKIMSCEGVPNHARLNGDSAQLLWLKSGDFSG